MTEDVVKSVGRVFEVLELFDCEQRPMSATGVERVLDYPQSSTLALLKSMVALGYLAYDRIERTYFPTVRVALLGSWLDQRVSGEASLHELMAEIGDATGETISLSMQNDLEMQFMALRAGANPLTLNYRPGDTLPIFHSSLGQVALAQKGEREVRKLLERVNRRTRAGATRLDPATIMAELRQVRKDGYAIGLGIVDASIGSVAWPLPLQPGHRQLILSVAGPIASIEEELPAIVRTTRMILKSWRHQ